MTKGKWKDLKVILGRPKTACKSILSAFGIVSKCSCSKLESFFETWSMPGRTYPVM